MRMKTGGETWMDRLPDSISAYIFDLDGVIFDSERAVFNEW